MSSLTSQCYFFREVSDDLMEYHFKLIPGEVIKNRPSDDELVDPNKRFKIDVKKKQIKVGETEEEIKSFLSRYPDFYGPKHCLDSLKSLPVTEAQYKEILMKIKLVSLTDIEMFFEAFEEKFYGILVENCPSIYSSRLNTYLQKGKLHFDDKGRIVTPNDLTLHTQTVDVLFEEKTITSVSNSLQKRFQREINRKSPKLHLDVILPVFFSYFMQKKFNINAHEVQYILQRSFSERYR